MTFANVTSLLALFIALGGTSYAALKITGKNVKDGSLTGADIKNNSVTTADIQNGSLVANDFKFGELKALQGPKGDKGDPGTGLPAGTSITKISYLADSGASSTTIYENDYFRITASCEADGPNVVVRPKTDHGAYAQSASSLNSTQTLYGHNIDTSTSSPAPMRFLANPEEEGTLTYTAPAGTSVTTITYSINYTYAGHDCAVLGNAVTT